MQRILSSSLLPLFLEICSLVVTVVKQLWFLPEDVSYPHKIASVLVMGWNKDRRKGSERHSVHVFLLETDSEKGSVRRGWPLFCY